MKIDPEYHGHAIIAGATGGLALFIGIARGIIQQKHGSLGGFIRGIVSSVLVAVLVGLGLYETSAPFTVKLSVIGVCAYLADDVLLGLLVIGSLFREDPGSFIGKLLDSLRGRHAPKTPSSSKENDK